MKRLGALLAIGAALGLGGGAYAATRLGATAAKATARTANVRGLSFAAGTAAYAPPASYGVPGEAFAVVYCPQGRHALSGGWNSSDTTDDQISITSSTATRGLRGWLVVAKDGSTDDTATGYTFQATAICG